MGDTADAVTIFDELSSFFEVTCWCGAAMQRHTKQDGLVCARDHAQTRKQETANG